MFIQWSSSEQKQFKLNKTILYIVTNQVMCTLRSLRIMGGIQNLIIWVKMALACVASVSSRVVRAGAKKKKKEGGGGGEKRKRLPRFWKTLLDISRFGSFVNWELVKIDNESITRFEKITLFPKTRSTRLQNCNKKKLYYKTRLEL